MKDLKKQYPECFELSDLRPKCDVCGEPSFSSPCIVCEAAHEREEAEKAFQRALNAMPADFVLTFSLMTATYYEGLADKENAGENIQLLCYFAKESVKEKSKILHS